MRPSLHRRLQRGIRILLTPILGPRKELEMWSRIVMNRETLKLIEARSPETKKVLEISGNSWKNRCKFKEYKDLHWPEYDICATALGERFDLIIAEQVFEHLLWPYRAGRHVYEMLNPGGLFLITTPFLVRIHENPVDCSRWTPLGMRHFLAECGFPFEKIFVDSWGNRSCVKANLEGWPGYHPLFHSLANEREYPISVWALAVKE